MGEEAMEGTDCRAKILSQDYRDFLIPGYREDIEAVSYTHLDVYKRQASRRTAAR